MRDTISLTGRGESRAMTKVKGKVSLSVFGVNDSMISTLINHVINLHGSV
jgi:hypothetical protein